MEPRVTEDQPVAAKVRDVESFSDFLIPSEYKKIEVVGNAPGLVIGSINVPELNWF